MKISVQNLERAFGNTLAVDDISFNFTSGQIFGFVGPNGAGKTTTMKIMATLDEPTGGDALIDGVSVVEYPEKARRLVGYMPDNLPRHRDMSVHEYLDFFARAYGVKGERRKTTIEQIEEFTNLTGIRNKTLVALSKGMAQRVSLARSLLHDPPVLIMDEPAAGLDPRARVELRELLKALAEQGKAILISSHILTELSEICHGVVIIERGRILAAGTIQDILAKARARMTVHIRVLERSQELCKTLLEHPKIATAKIVDEGKLTAEINGDVATCCDLLADIVLKGFRVAEFNEQRINLEEVFMKITRGEVV